MCPRAVLAVHQYADCNRVSSDITITGQHPYSHTDFSRQIKSLAKHASPRTWSAAILMRASQFAITKSATRKQGPERFILLLATKETISGVGTGSLKWALGLLGVHWRFLIVILNEVAAR